ncbi:unnamed protein product [Bursaphelenchus xylophilus]|uniref:(pine wood nematode) hypothetical protein n=1 Tax=Bursaphelenchus xylophilus TaxID=6326 RepID=A0A1I7S176_BURXY|nr:unnamed protein product [Bursaphelenchus xylophilus]CAG9080079.1 unnamed protein product [Bursaphelenchus xylophilus]
MAEKYKCERKAHLKYQIKLLREKVEKIPETPNEIYGNPAFSDFRIQAGDETFYVTKYQLALKSKVFNRMFVSGMKEVDEGVVQIDDDPEAVGAMLKFLYLGKRVKGVEMAKNVVQLADRYEMTELKDQCELELLDNLTVAGSQDAFIFASQFQLSHLFLMATALLYYNFKGFGNDKLEGRLP